MQSKELRLLITDDDADFRVTLGEALSRRGFATLLAADGIEALEVIANEQIHLALFDVHMPRLDGLRALESIRPLRPLLPCILMSANVDDSIIARAQALNAEQVLPKPFSLAKLSETIHRLLRTAS